MPITNRRLWLLLLSLLIVPPAVLSLAPGTARADTRTVDCATGRKIATAFRVPAGRPLTITVRGTCIENVHITRDDVTLQGEAGATVQAADATRPAILIDAARRVRLLGLTVKGGAGVIVGSPGAIFDVAARAGAAGSCVVQGGTRYGIIAHSGSSATVDGCTVQNVDGYGILAVSNSTIVIMNSTVQDNTSTGISATRNSSVMVGVNTSSTAFGPVTVQRNARNGIAISNASTGAIMQTTIDDNGNSGIFVGRASHADIGGTGVTATNSITRSGHNGVSVESGSATILGTTISLNDQRGVSFFGGATGRIGIRTDDSAYVGNTISENVYSGIEISNGSAATIGGNTVRANGTGTSESRFGIAVHGASAEIAGGNLIENHPRSGIFVSRSGNVVIGARHGSLDPANTIKNNGIGPSAGQAYGGIFAFQDAAVDVRDATITGNRGYGVLAWKGSNVSMRNVTITGTTAEPNEILGSGRGVAAAFAAKVRLRENITISGNASDGIGIFSGSAVEFRNDGIGTKQVIDNDGYGVFCGGLQVAFSNGTTFPIAPVATLSPNDLGETNTTGSGCSGWE